MKFFGPILITLFASSVFAFPLTPNPAWTTGDICTRQNPDYEQDRYPEKIAYCNRNVDSQTKTKIYDLYHVPKECRDRYTIDHFIPLSIGGTNSPANLWPEHRLVKDTRRTLESDVFELVKAGKIAQKNAVQAIMKAKTTLKNAPQSSHPCDRIGFGI